MDSAVARAGAIDSSSPFLENGLPGEPPSRKYLTPATVTQHASERAHQQVSRNLFSVLGPGRSCRCPELFHDTKSCRLCVRFLER